MAKRLKTRLSAGAAVVTGLGMIGIAAASPSQAAIAADLEYTCELTNEGLAKKFTDPWKVNLSVDAPDQVETGATIEAPGITATVIPGNDAASQLRSLNVKTLEGTSKAAYTFGAEERSVDLTIPTTDVPAEGDIKNVATGTGEEETAPAEDGEIDITAGDFTADLTTDTGFVLNISCAAPSDAAVGSITVGEGSGEEPEPTPTTSEPTTSEPTTSEPTTSEPTAEENDWFEEPSSLPITSDEKNFTVKGTASQAGVVKVVLLDKDKNVLRADDWNVAEGSNSKDFPFAEGTDYVRLDSQECVDANGNTEADGAAVEGGNGCSVEYYAPWSNPDNGDDGSDDGDDAGNGDDSGEGAPETPGVVQTDGFQRSTAPQQDNTLAIALGGLLLAGAGAGTVLVARRRAAAQH